MPTKNVNDETWDLIEKETVRAVIATKKAIKDTQVLDILIKKGIATITDKDYLEYAAKKWASKS